MNALYKTTIGRKNQPWLYTALPLAALIASVSGLSGCDGRKAGAQAGTRGTSLVLILDETDSFAGHWDESVRDAAAAVARLYPGDCLLVLGLDNHSWDEADVRVPVTTLPYQTLAAARERARLASLIRGLKPRPTSSGSRVNGRLKGIPKGTDTSGVLDFASKLAEDPEGRGVSLCLFSDLNDEPKGVRSSRQNPNPFPPGTRFSALYVSAGNGERAEARISRWVNSMRSVFGVNCTGDDFHLTSQSHGVALVGRRGG